MTPLWIGGVAFARPAALVALIILVPAAAAVLAWSARRRARDLARFGDPALLAQTALLAGARERRARAALRVGALALLLLALARPQWGATATEGTATGGDVFIMLDLSRSMNAQDIAPSRLDAAKRAAATIARAMPESRVGLVVFGGSAFLQLPPTLDHSTFERFLEHASTLDIPDPSTNLETVAELAGAAAAREGDTTGVDAVLLSDGEDVEGKLMDAVDTFRAAHVRVFALGFGTPDGATIPDPDDTSSAGGASVHHDYAGRVVITHLQENNLKDIARLTGGTYARWAGEGSVRPIAAGLARAPGRPRRSGTGAPMADRFQWPLALALVALAADAAIAAVPRRRQVASRPSRRTQRRARRRAVPAGAGTVLALAAALHGASCAGGPGSRRARAERLYDARDFHGAYDAFGSLARDAAPRGAPGAAVLEYDAGDAAYRLGRFAEAVRHFRAALAGPPALQQHAQYNLGNAYVWLARGETDKRGSLRAAINAYEAAVLLDPTDVDAKWNLELAVERLASEQTRLSGGPHREANWGGGNLTKSGYEGTPQTGAGATPGGGYGTGGGEDAVPEITESDARRILKETEQAQVTGQEMRRPVGGSRRAARIKDW